MDLEIWQALETQGKTRLDGVNKGVNGKESCELELIVLWKISAKKQKRGRVLELEGHLGLEI